ncbi:MAG: primosomal protein N' [Candidatus Omnitrophota bacterium]
MLYAKVVLGLAVKGPFDYIVPENLAKVIKPGARVWVPFRNSRKLGYAVGLAKETSIKNLKKISEVIDNYPILDKNMLLLAKELSEYYCCSWGEAIEAALPEGLRKGKKIEGLSSLFEGPCLPAGRCSSLFETILIHDLDGKKRWDIYLEHIKAALSNNRSVIVLLPDMNSALNAKEIIESGLGLPSLSSLYRKGAGELEEWLKIKTGKVNIVIGSRSCVFAPVKDLGLIIIDDEQNSVYKQEQSPHYNAREAAFTRAKIEKARLILGSVSPSLESFYLAEKNKSKYMQLSRNRDFPEIKVIDMRSVYRAPKQKGLVLSRYLEDAIAASINSGGKALLFLDRKGFATFASCSTCGKTLKCPRCDINLVYHFDINSLNCHYCNFKSEAPKICPECNSGYIRFFGAGTEKIESELSRIFVKAVVKRLESREDMDIKSGDIFVATSAVIKHANYNFDIVGVLGIDNSLNRIDLRSSEKAFASLLGLLGLTERKFIIQTALPMNNCFQALVKKDIGIFYKEELKQRKQLGFPPYKHMVLVKLRGKYEDKVKQASLSLSERLNTHNKSKDIRILSVNPGYPSKLRGNFYWQILISSGNPKKVSEFLKTCLKSFSSSGIIVTVDVDPL